MVPLMKLSLQTAFMVSLSLGTALLSAQEGRPAKFSAGQELVVAAFELDVDRVKTLLQDGVDPNSRLGFYDKHIFEDKWTLGYSAIGSARWTPLLAVAESHEVPQPEERAVNTTEGLEIARKQREAVEAKLIEERNSRRLAIVKLLISAQAGLDLDDGYGATALYKSICNGYEDVALLLIAAGAKLDTKTAVYIDGSAGITSLHRATKGPRVLKAMLQRGAKVNVADSAGSTPLHWAVLASEPASIKLLVEAGADRNAIDEDGRKPADWLSPRNGSADRDAATQDMERMLQPAITGK